MQNTEQVQWPGWKTVRVIGRGSFGSVYEIERELFGKTEKAALKHIGIPQNPSDIDELYSDGYDSASITATFRNHLQSIIDEYSLMRQLNGSANVVNCDDVQYVQRDDGIGWDIYIKMELLTPLTKALPDQIPPETTVKMAKDLCRALILCNRFHIVHRDIKPQNIFVSPLGDYKLGDFGIAKTVEKTMGGTKTGTYKYMAPEVYNNQPYGQQADIYSLGLVLYWMLNKRRMPFMPLPPASIGAGMDEESKRRRFSGEPLPPPADGSEALKRIVLKACAFSTEQRYRSANEMLADLEALHECTEEASGITAANPVQPAKQYAAEDIATPVFDDSDKTDNGERMVVPVSAPVEAEDTEATLGALGKPPRKQSNEQDHGNRTHPDTSAEKAAASARAKGKPKNTKKLLIPIIAVSAVMLLAVALLLWKPWASGGAAAEKPTEQALTSDTSAPDPSKAAVASAANPVPVDGTGLTEAPYAEGFHIYEIVADDCSWTQAQQEASRRGGHLVCFETEEEYSYVIGLLEKEAPELEYLWIGMHREENSTEYYWVDQNTRPFGACLNASASWCNAHWQEGEPTLEWKGEQENCGLLQHNKKQNTWGLNDAKEALSDRYSEKQGYIMEYESAFTAGIHKYEFVKDACSWLEAQQKAKQLGGHLVCFETREEYDYVLEMLKAEASDLTYLRIGTRRKAESTEYYWVDQNSRNYGPCLNTAEIWCKDIWFTGEPTIEWEGTPEEYGVLSYNWDKKQWGWNDTADAISESFNPEIVGFIVEFE